MSTPVCLPCICGQPGCFSVVGRDVTDVTMGELGIVTDVMGGPAQDVLVIEGPWGEVLLPVVPEIVREVPSRGAIVVEAPRGSVGGGAS